MGWDARIWKKRALVWEIKVIDTYCQDILPVVLFSTYATDDHVEVSKPLLWGQRSSRPCWASVTWRCHWYEQFIVSSDDLRLGFSRSLALMYDHLQVSEIIYSNTLARAGVKANLLQWLMPWLDMNQREVILELNSFSFCSKIVFRYEYAIRISEIMLY